MRPFEIILHNQLCMIQSQMVITLSGIRQVLKLGDGWINLSWLHSIKKIDKNKVLVLFYHMSPLVDGRKPSMESQLLEFTDREAAEEFYEALQVVHKQQHDQSIEKIYHQSI